MRYLLIIFTVFLISSCTDQKKMENLQAEVERLQVQNNTMQTAMADKDSFLTDYVNTIDEVYDNLEMIRKREGFLTRLPDKVENNQDPNLKEKILHNIASIDTYIKNSRAKVADLEQKVKTRNVSIAGLEETITRLNMVITEREETIRQLQTEITGLTNNLTNMKGLLTEKEAIISDQKTKIETGFYVIGNRKDLKAKNIINEKGGFLGLGKTKTISDKISPDAFTKISVVKTETIALPDSISKIDIVTSHAPDSYHVIEDEDGPHFIEIIDPQEFWKTKYLVVVTK